MTLGGMADPGILVLFGAGVVGLVALAIVETIKRWGAPTGGTWGMLVFAALLCLGLSVSRDHYRAGVVHDAAAESLGVVLGATVTSGGCAPTRTDIALRDDSGFFTVRGRFDAFPGNELVKKVVPHGTFVCLAGTDECAKLQGG